MIAIMVHIHVKPECIEAFKAASVENARHSLQEPGIARFDVLQAIDAPNRFILYEVYRDLEATTKHKETTHYLKWRDRVADMMAEPRQGIKHVNLFPSDLEWT